MEFSLILIAGRPSLHGSQHFGELEIVKNLLLCHLHDLSLPFQNCKVLIHLVLLKFTLELRALLFILKQIDYLLCYYCAVAYQFFKFGCLAPAELKLGQVMLLHGVSSKKIQ